MCYRGNIHCTFCIILVAITLVNTIGRRVGLAGDLSSVEWSLNWHPLIILPRTLTWLWAKSHSRGCDAIGNHPFTYELTHMWCHVYVLKGDPRYRYAITLACDAKHSHFLTGLFVNNTKWSKTWDNLNLGSNVGHREFWGSRVHLVISNIVLYGIVL